MLFWVSLLDFVVAINMAMVANTYIAVRTTNNILLFVVIQSITHPPNFLCLTLALSGMQQAPRSGILLLRVRDE